MQEELEQMGAQPDVSSDNDIEERTDTEEVDLDDADDAEPGDTEAETQEEEGVEEEEDPYVKQLEETVNKYKESLRAVTRERNEAKARLRELQAGGGQAQESAADSLELEQLSKILTSTQDLEVPTVNGYKDAGVIVHPVLKGRPWDETSELVCLGDVDNPKDWYPREQAIKLATAEAILSKIETIKQEQAQAEAQARLEKMVNQLEQAGQEMLKNALPSHFERDGVPDELMNVLRSMAATEMYNRGVTVQRLASDDQEAVNIALDTMKDVVKNIRKIIATFSRVTEETRQDAKEKAPVPATGTASVPVGKRTSEMTRAEHRRYLRDLALRKLGLIPRGD